MRAGRGRRRRRGSGCCLPMRIRCMSRAICRGRCMRRRGIGGAAVVFAAADCDGVLAAGGDAAGVFGAGECVSAEAGERSGEQAGGGEWAVSAGGARGVFCGGRASRRWGARCWKMWRWRGRSSGGRVGFGFGMLRMRWRRGCIGRLAEMVEGWTKNLALLFAIRRWLLALWRVLDLLLFFGLPVLALHCSAEDALPGCGAAGCCGCGPVAVLSRVARSNFPGGGCGDFDSWDSAVCLAAGAELCCITR